MTSEETRKRPQGLCPGQKGTNPSLHGLLHVEAECSRFREDEDGWQIKTSTFWDSPHRRAAVWTMQTDAARPKMTEKDPPAGTSKGNNAEGPDNGPWCSSVPV